jgi:FAD/FMN-containing dehydrogenase
MKNFKKKINQKFALSAIFLTLVIVVVARKIQEYSADPSGEKDCPPLPPDFAGDSSKQNSIEAIMPSLELPWSQKGGTVNDASCLDKTPVFGIVQVKEVEDISKALIFAKENKLKVSIAGVRHSMGGQAFFKNVVMLDMTKFNKISVDESKMTMTVQSGATWHDIQNILHPKFAVKAMQSTDIFTVGGSISVNAHGMDHQVGSVGKTVRSIRIMSPNGTIKRVSRTENPELFRLVIGGYGLFGVILDAEIDITENVVYQSERKIIDYKDFPELFKNEIANDKKLGLMYIHLSTAPQSFLKETILYTYKQVDDINLEIPPLGEVSGIKFRRLIFNLAKQGSIPMRMKWFLEKYIEPKLEVCPISRNQALGEGEACLVARNEPMHDSVPYLRNSLKGETDILQEYFIPRDKFIPFVDGIREILVDNEANVLNASVRVAHKEDNFLNYSPVDTFSIVLYLNQRTDEAGNAKMKKLTGELIDFTTKVGGKFFLPYQLHYSADQLKQAYPEIGSFFDQKMRYDTELLITSKFYEKYSREIK